VITSGQNGVGKKLLNVALFHLAKFSILPKSRGFIASMYIHHQQLKL